MRSSRPQKSEGGGIAPAAFVCRVLRCLAQFTLKLVLAVAVLLPLVASARNA